MYFNLFLPSPTAAHPKPPGGWPVVLYVHGNGLSKNDWPFAVAAVMASHGIATMAINVVGHGFRRLGDGAGGTLEVKRATGEVVTFSAGGRAEEQFPPVGPLGGTEGSIATGAGQLVLNAHTRLQSAIDLMQLVRVIERGVHVDPGEDPAAAPDLDPSRIYAMGSSAGAYVVAALAAAEPAVRATVMNGALSSVEMFRLDPASRGGPNGVGTFLAGRNPSPVNDDPTGTVGVRLLGCVRVSNPGPFFDENTPLRAPAVATSLFPPASPVVNTVPGAMALQELFDRMEWATEASAPQALAPHMKNVLILFARGDRSDVNPNTAAIVRAGGLAGRAVMYQHDRFSSAFGAQPVPNPHRFLLGVPCGRPPEAKQCVATAGELPATPELTRIARFAQHAAAHFLETNGAELLAPTANDAPLDQLFEVPVANGVVPEDLGFVGATCP